MKYIFVTGGVVSGLGKGITAASIGRLLINRGFRVTIQKLDPYLNVDPGIMSPLEHGEVFITEDGAECDVDVGHYERFIGRNFSRNNNLTSGRIYSTVINRERTGEYNGKTIQVIPHITNEVKDVMRSIGLDKDIVIVEVGGTVGDMEQMAFIEAIRQFRKELGFGNSISVHVTLVPNVHGEIKTKPTQHSVREISQMGVYPDFVICRTTSDTELTEDTRKKIAMYCNLDGPEFVIHNKDCATIYQVPIMMKEQKLDDLIFAKLGLSAPEGDLSDWKKMVEGMLSPRKVNYNVSIIGDYVATEDAYYSITEALKHAGLACKVGINVKYVHTKDAEKIKNADLKIFADKAPYVGKKPRPPQFSSKPYAPNKHFVDLIKNIAAKVSK